MKTVRIDSLNNKNQGLNFRYSEKDHWLSVLLVEDEPLIQRVHSKMLESLGCCIDIAEDGYQALEKLTDSDHYDIIFMDIGLPRMNGIETVKKIRQRPDYQTIPIIGLTAYSLEEIQVQCRTAGFDEVFVKPIGLNGLKSILLKLAKERIAYPLI